MSFGGSVGAMIISLKNNSRPRKKSRGRKSDLHVDHITPIKKKEISDDDLELVKNQIKLRLFKERKRKFNITLVICGIIILICGLGFFLTKNIILESSHRNREILRGESFELLQIEIQKKKEILRFIELGNKSISNKEYSKAKDYFSKAIVKDHENHEAYIGITKAHIQDCLENGNECKLAEHFFRLVTNKYDNDFVKKELGQLYFKMEEKINVDIMHQELNKN